MQRSGALVLLAILCAGVFVSGLELLITAVALPSIITWFGEGDWRVLRLASWVVNGYLLAFIVTMPLAGRLTDLFGARRLFLGAIVVFTIGSFLAGRAQSLEELIAARVVQALGGGALVPVATAAASHLFEGHARPRALGLVGALTFLGMAAGPFVAAAILGSIHPDAVAENLRQSGGPAAVADVIAPAWRYVFYVNVPIGIIALVFGWAASAGWDTPRRTGRIDIPGAILFSLVLVALLAGLTLLGVSATPDEAIDPATLVAILFGVAAVGLLVFVIRGIVARDTFLDPRLFRSVEFSSATLVSLLTGYGFATAIVGGVVFVDRVLYGGPEEQRLALGALAGATAVGALASGFAVRVLSLRLVTVAGLALSAAALAWIATWTPGVSIEQAALALAAFGLGFGLTVTPRSTAAVEAVGRSAFGAASATVTVARMIGMAVGLAILTAYGSTTIERLSGEIYATPESYRQFIPAELRDRPLRDGLVVEALEGWASGEAARILVGIFVGAAGLTLVAVAPALVMGRRPRTIMEPERAGPAAGSAGPGGDDDDGADQGEPPFAI